MSTVRRRARKETNNTDQSMTSVTRQDRYRGSVLGMAAGDALGTTLEFKRPGDPSVPPLTDIVRPLLETN